jgi:Ni2+-binding GTPase involved in maturation of urease and hydrogenase
MQRFDRLDFLFVESSINLAAHFSREGDSYVTDVSSGDVGPAQGRSCITQSDSVCYRRTDLKDLMGCRPHVMERDYMRGWVVVRHLKAA